MSLRLSLETLSRAAPGVRVPGYGPRAVTPGIVHLGIGAFHRGHQAVYVDDCLAAGDRGWGIVGVSLRSPGVRDALQPQDGLYTLLERSEDRETARIVGSVREVLVAPEEPERVLRRLAAESTRIVSLTVTEKGYCHDPATGRLRENDPDVIADIAHTDTPRTAPGFIVAALRRRRDAGLRPFTVLSCDNLAGNGRVCRRVVAGLAALTDPGLARAIEDEVAFPSTMVDRIVPATSDAGRERALAATGLRDAYPVVAEPFSQWVVEDDFAAGRPALDAVGAQMVRNVEPFEVMKLRLLNGTHSFLAYSGLLAGFETIAEVVADRTFADAARLYMAEVRGTVAAPPGVDLIDYEKTVLARFANGAIRYGTAQVASDGSQKLTQRIVPAIREQIARRGALDWLSLAVAAWMRCVSGIDSRGSPLAVRDPMAERLARIGTTEGIVADRLVPAYLAIESIFDRAVAENPRFVAAVTANLDQIIRLGIRRAVATRLPSHP